MSVSFVVGIITLAFHKVGLTNPSTVALSFLLVVLATAARWGLFESLFTSVVATFFFNYFFLPPVGTLTIADPQNWVALFAFLIVAVVASHLSEQARRKTREAVEHQQQTERLYSLSRMILMLGGDPAHVAGEIAGQLRQVFEAESVALFDRESGQILRAGKRPIPIADAQLKEIALRGNVEENIQEQFVALPISLGGKSLGSLGIAGISLSDGVRQAVANLIAIALESARGRESAGRAVLARQSEEFKSTLLDALAHELKTPLTSVKASVSALLDGTAKTGANEKELLSIIQEETERLTRLVSEALQLAKIAAGKLHLEKQSCTADALIRTAIEASSRLLDVRQVQVKIVPDLPEVSADAALIGTVLQHLLENAAKFSPVTAPIHVQADASEGQVQFSVIDRGPGLDEHELSLVFEKYYRGARTREAVAGVGMGLAIARDIIFAHGGKMWAESSPGQGARFSFTLPIATVLKQT